MARERRLTFGQVAELYDQTRPSYPAELVSDVLGLLPPSSTPSALEVGAGTGKATALFAQRGISVHALEPSAEMAAVAQRNLRGLGNVTIERQDFESWDPRGVSFPLVYAAQAWHWIAPEVGYAKARSALRVGGLLAAFWNRADWRSCPFRAELEDAYRRAVPERSFDDPMHPGAASAPDMWESWEREIQAAHGLGKPELRGYRWAQRYTTSDYLALLRTHSPNIVLEDARREALLTEVGRVLDDHGTQLTIDYVTWLYLARAC